eukprot:794744-Amphidinium_carterae.2
MYIQTGTVEDLFPVLGKGMRGSDEGASCCSWHVHVRELLSTLCSTFEIARGAETVLGSTCTQYG